MNLQTCKSDSPRYPLNKILSEEQCERYPLNIILSEEQCEQHQF